MPRPWRRPRRVLVGRHDFTTFRAAGCQAKSPVKTLDRLDVTTAGDEIVVEASARSFLHNQVRSMVGSLKLVGEGKWRAADLAAALAARDRAACGPVAPARGLYLAGRLRGRLIAAIAATTRRCYAHAPWPWSLRARKGMVAAHAATTLTPVSDMTSSTCPT